MEHRLYALLIVFIIPICIEIHLTLYLFINILVLHKYTEKGVFINEITRMGKLKGCG